MNTYAYEKIQELERARLARQPRFEPPRNARRPVFGSLAAGAGRALRRAGEGLESWANLPLPEADHRVAGRAR